MHPKVKEYLESVQIINGQKWIMGDVDLFNSGLTSLDFHDIHIKGNFYCSNNNLTSLEGSPKTVGGNFDCSHNNITTLEGSPETVGGNFYCSYNKLTSLEGISENIGGAIYIDEVTDPDLLKTDKMLEYILSNKVKQLINGKWV